VCIQDKRDFQVHPVAHDLAVLHHNLLLFDPSAFDVLDRFRRGLDSLIDGILEACCGFGADFDNFARDMDRPPFSDRWDSGPVLRS